MSKLPVKKSKSALARPTRSLISINAALRKIRRLSRVRKIGKRVREIEKKGIELDLFDTLDFLEKSAPHSEEAKRLHDSLTKQLTYAMDEFREPSMRVSKPSERIPLEQILRNTKTFLKSPEALEAYSRYRQAVAKEIASGGLGRLGASAASRHYNEAVAARLASMRKRKRLPKKTKKGQNR